MRKDDAKCAGIASHLHLPGTVLRMELPLSVSDLYVTANVGPVPGVAGLQAVAAGVPLVALQVSPDYRPRASDWIWSSHDPHEVGERAVELLRSPETLAELARRQREYLEANHSPAAMARDFDALYRDAIRARG